MLQKAAMSTTSSTSNYTPQLLTAELLAGAGPGTNPNEASVSGTDKSTKMDAVNMIMSRGDLNEKIPSMSKELMENGLSPNKTNLDHNTFSSRKTTFAKAKDFPIGANLRSSMKDTAMRNKQEKEMEMTFHDNERNEENKKIQFSPELYENLDNLNENLLTMPPLCNEETAHYAFRSRKFIIPTTFGKAKKYHSGAKVQSPVKKTSMANRQEEVMEITLNENERSEEKKKIRFSTELYENLDKLYEDLLTTPPLCNEETDPYTFSSNSMSQALSTITNKPLLSCGLPNFESNCYINASLQCLFTAATFCKELSDLLENVSPITNDKFFRCFVQLSRIRNSSDVHNNNEMESLLMELIKSAAHINPEFTISQQNDAHEFLCHCLTQLEESVKRLSSEKNVESSCPVGSNFVFKMRNIIRCLSCEFTRSKVEVFNHISVPPNQNSVEQCLHDLLNNPTVLESLCEKCGGKSATSMWTLHTLPKFLILHLNRFKVTEFGTIRKLITPVDITPELQISFLPYLETPRKENSNDEASESDPNELVKESPGDTVKDEGKLSFQLISFISHIGQTQFSGHYVTDCSTNNPDQWMTCNDEIVTLINKSDILQLGSINAYVLLYEKVSTDTRPSSCVQSSQFGLPPETAQ